MTSVSFTPEEHKWASKTALRLRLLQSGLGEDAPEQRRGYLDDAVQEALREIVVEKRARHVLALAEHFPTGFISKPVDATPTDNSPEAMVDALVKIAGKLPPSARADFGLRLQEAGYMELKTTTLVNAPPEELQRTLQLEDAAQVDIGRLYRALHIFIEYYLGLENVIWKTWQKIGENSAVKQDKGPNADVRRLAARYIQGDSEVSSEQLRQQVEKTRRVMGGLVGAMPTGASAFLEQFYAEFSPEKIELLAKNDKDLKGGWGQEAKNWNKFKRMMTDQMGGVFEEKFFDALARAAEALMVGTTRK